MRTVDMQINGQYWQMQFEIDEDDYGPFPMMRQYIRDGFPVPRCDVKQYVKDELIQEAYRALRARGMEEA